MICRYVTVDDMNRTVKNNIMALNMVEYGIITHLNIRSLKGKIDNINDLVSSIEGALCIGITETWGLLDNIEYIQSFDSYCLNRTKSKGGGVALFIKKSANNFTLNGNFSSIKAYCEMITVENNDLIISNVYRPPGTNNSNLMAFLDLMERLFTYANTCKKKLCVVGDFNIDFLENNQSFKDFNDLILTMGFINTINLPTRITLYSKTLLDLCITNIIEYDTGIIESDISDHLPIFIVIDIAYFKSKVKTTHNSSELNVYYCRNYNNDNIEGFRTFLRQFNVLCKVRR